MNVEDAAVLHLIHGDRIALVNDIGRCEGRVFLAPLARGNLQIHWPEGNVIIRQGVVDQGGGVPDYNARVKSNASQSREQPHPKTRHLGHPPDEDSAGECGGPARRPRDSLAVEAPLRFVFAAGVWR